jgi:hypothetical protein
MKIRHYLLMFFAMWATHVGTLYAENKKHEKVKVTFNQPETCIEARLKLNRKEVMVLCGPVVTTL